MYRETITCMRCRADWRPVTHCVDGRVIRRDAGAVDAVGCALAR